MRPFLIFIHPYFLLFIIFHCFIYFIIYAISIALGIFYFLIYKTRTIDLNLYSALQLIYIDIIKNKKCYVTTKVNEKLMKL